MRASLYEYLKERMSVFPDKTLRYGDDCVTYRELLDGSPLSLNELRYRNKLAILCESPLNAARVILACMKARCVVVPLSYQYGQAYIDRLRNRFCLGHAITDRDGTLQIEYDGKLIGHPLEEDIQTAFLLCTSGTSGTPKGAMLTEQGVVANLEGIESYFHIGSSDKILIARPLYHCAVLVGEFITALCRGLDIEFINEFDPAGIIRRVKLDGVTVLGGTPTIFYRLCQTAKRMKETIPLRAAAISGECMTRAAADAIIDTMPDTNIYHVYGLTEAGPRVSALPPEQFRDAPLSVGFPLPGVELRIEDGELLIKSPAVMKGYYRDCDLTETAFTDGDRSRSWLRTGDGAELDDRGRLYIKGRRDDMIIRAGMNIYPREIEDAVKTDPRAAEVLAYGVRDGVTQRIHLKAVAPGLTKNDVMAICRERLPICTIPDSIEVVDELPRNASGKLLRPKDSDP